MWDPSVIPGLRLTLSPQFLVGCLRALAGQPAGRLHAGAQGSASRTILLPSTASSPGRLCKPPLFCQWVMLPDLLIRLKLLWDMNQHSRCHRPPRPRCVDFYGCFRAVALTPGPLPLGPGY